MWSWAVRNSAQDLRPVFRPCTTTPRNKNNPYPDTFLSSCFFTTFGISLFSCKTGSLLLLLSSFFFWLLLNSPIWSVVFFFRFNFPGVSLSPCKNQPAAVRCGVHLANFSFLDPLILIMTRVSRRFARISPRGDAVWNLRGVKNGYSCQERSTRSDGCKKK